MLQLSPPRLSLPFLLHSSVRCPCFPSPLLFSSVMQFDLFIAGVITFFCLLMGGLLWLTNKQKRARASHSSMDDLDLGELAGSGGVSLSSGTASMVSLQLTDLLVEKGIKL